MKKTLLFILLLLMALIALMPKENLYFTLVNMLSKERIGLNQAAISDQWYRLKLQDLKLSYDGIESAQAEVVSIMPLLVFNTIHATNVEASESFKKMFPFVAENVDIHYALWNYKEASISAQGDFGVLRGAANLLDRNIKLVLEPSQTFSKNPMLRQYFKKTEEGYVYESKF